MRHCLLSLGVIGSLFLGSLQGQEPAGKDEKNKATHDAIRKVRDGVIDAINKKDVDALLSHLTEDVVFTAQDGDEQKVIRKKAGVRDYIERLLTGPNPGVKSLKIAPKVDELTILYQDQTGIAFGSSEDHYVLADGTEFDLATRWSATLVNEGGDWRIANLHISSNLFDNPVIEALESTVRMAAVVAGIIGLLLGLLLVISIGRIRGRSAS